MFYRSYPKNIIFLQSKNVIMTVLKLLRNRVLSVGVELKFKQRSFNVTFGTGKQKVIEGETVRSRIRMPRLH